MEANLCKWNKKITFSLNFAFPRSSSSSMNSKMFDLEIKSTHKGQELVYKALGLNYLSAIEFLFISSQLELHFMTIASFTHHNTLKITIWSSKWRRKETNLSLAGSTTTDTSDILIQTVIFLTEEEILRNYPRTR